MDYSWYQPCPPPMEIPAISSYLYPAACTIINCSEPPPDLRNPKVFCKAYFPKIEPINAIRFLPGANLTNGCGPWTNLAYCPLIQGGIGFNGVGKLVPSGPPPGPPTLCRPKPVAPTDSPGMIVYRAP